MIGRVRAAAGDTRRALPFLLRGLASSAVALVLLIRVLLVAVFTMIGVGWLAIPSTVRSVRRWAAGERRRVAGYTGRPVPPPYDPPAEPDALGAHGAPGGPAVPARELLAEPATRRDLGWLAFHGLTGLVVGLLALLLPLSVVNAAVVPVYWWAVPSDEPVQSPYPVTSWLGALGMLPLGLGWLVLTLLLVPLMARWQAGAARGLLRPTRDARLSERVTELTATRAAALEAHGAELRRIERDLHDGTQNRLVGVIMHLGIAERALRRDPQSALPLLLKAQNQAADALGELRDVVRSIYPPVLAERGLDGALAALAARCPVPCTLRAGGLRRLPAALEAAAYFVVAEALTNTAKHSGAEQVEVTVTLRPPPEPGDEEAVVIEVRDDGHGGADESGGSGLAGIRRRVAAFDGSTEVTSPAGGPTVVRAVIPCAS
ncbi:sensor histidine kinase [Jiangella alkaliphila]|uniref:histidine kinase n=1 Tax=Jiangella alkaliphila TaxID=419479 RepID=A0A1H2FVV2_9ACTN|nr:sensor histidine kinase [Jiangella alkaliphila]SDU11449.1 Signal transduction histidine kinase [Jiangella alkaliphila]